MQTCSLLQQTRISLLRCWTMHCHQAAKTWLDCTMPQQWPKRLPGRAWQKGIHACTLDTHTHTHTHIFSLTYTHPEDGARLAGAGVSAVFNVSHRRTLERCMSRKRGTTSPTSWPAWAKSTSRGCSPWTAANAISRHWQCSALPASWNSGILSGMHGSG